MKLHGAKGRAESGFPMSVGTASPATSGPGATFRTLPKNQKPVGINCWNIRAIHEFQTKLKILLDLTKLYLHVLDLMYFTRDLPLFYRINHKSRLRSKI